MILGSVDLVSWGLVCRLDILVRFSVAFVLDVSDVTGVAIDVICDNLLATVGKNDRVRSSGFIAIAAFVFVHVDVVVIVLHGILVFVMSGSL